MNKNIAIGALAVGVAVFALLAFKAPSVITLTKQGEIQVVKVPVSSGSQTITVPAPVVNVNAPVSDGRVGSVSGNEIQGPEFISGGVRSLSFSQNLITSTSTPCFVRNNGATSTLALGTANIIVPSTATSTTWYLGYNSTTTAYGSSTLIETYSLASSAKGVFINTGSSTPIIPPYAFVGWSVKGIDYAGGNVSSLIHAGVCKLRLFNL